MLLSEIPQSFPSSETKSTPQKREGFFLRQSYCVFSKCKPLKNSLFLGKQNPATVNPDQIIFLSTQRKHLCSFPDAHSFHTQQETKLTDSGLPHFAATQRDAAARKSRWLHWVLLCKSAPHGNSSAAATDFWQRYLL